MTRFKNIAFILILVFLFVEILIIFPQQLEKIDADPIPEPTQNSAASGTAEHSAGGVHLAETRNGARDWELFAKVAELYQDKGLWDMKEVKAQFYNENELGFTVVGDVGTVDTKTKDMKISGRVLLTSLNGYVFSTDELFYDAKLRQIRSPKPIQMKAAPDEQGEGLLLKGKEMTVYVEKNRMLVRNNVQATKTLSAAKKFDLTSETAEFSGKSREAIFAGGVVILYGTTRIEGPTASFFYNKSKDRLKNILLDGGVRVTDQEKYALSDVMNLDVESNNFTFTGKPRVYQNNDELSGEQIIFLDGGKKVRVEKIRAKVDK